MTKAPESEKTATVQTPSNYQWPSLDCLKRPDVVIRDLFESDEWRNSKAQLPIALGKDVHGHSIIADLAEMPHMLIAGSTGTGKSVCINSIIASLLYRFTPDQLRFVMIDPKVVELQQYYVLPHLAIPIINDPKKALTALVWVVNEIEKRFRIFTRVGTARIQSFNARIKSVNKMSPGEDIVIPETLPHIVVIITELADLMLVAPAKVEMAIARITQMARAAGIHCIVATQRPSADVITGGGNDACKLAR